MTIDAPIPYLPVESAFDEITHLAGGCRVDSLFDGKTGWENADYFFERIAFVAELKEITYEASTDKVLRERLSKIYRQHADRDDMPIVFSTAPIRIDFLPEDCRREMILPFKRKLEGCVKKAACQIKETKVRLKVNGAKGLLILVNEASTFLRPDLTFYFLYHILMG